MGTSRASAGLARCCHGHVQHRTLDTACATGTVLSILENRQPDTMAKLSCLAKWKQGAYPSSHMHIQFSCHHPSGRMPKLADVAICQRCLRACKRGHTVRCYCRLRSTRLGQVTGRSDSMRQMRCLLRPRTGSSMCHVQQVSTVFMEAPPQDGPVPEALQTAHYASQQQHAMPLQSWPSTVQIAGAGAGTAVWLQARRSRGNLQILLAARLPACVHIHSSSGRSTCPH